ncbi:MAG: 3-phosphoshikimate 1-carboxyvinyltransferase [Erysipelotrichia bacterium]|nr:3-phosphoshikimate 1-carboxyvinyltransferase [Erysipelotrichia bacterium]NCC55033.1 3-phosphoshikimate 1-carboxyvinyltransferase [Erysipelotrichia bacterium]
MKVKVFPSKVAGEVMIPPSKSMSHRAIICASLADGKSIIDNVAYSDDIKITIEGMKHLGAHIVCEENRVIIQGIKDFTKLQTNEIFCNESGSTLRFFIPIFSLCEQMIHFTGRNRLLKRPQTIYEEIFKAQGITYVQDDEKITIQGKLKPAHYTLNGDVSSQFISGLLFTLPLLDGDSTIHIKEPFESKSYVDLTLQMLHHYGINAQYSDANTLYVAGNQRYQPHDYTIEGDYSQLAFFAVLAAINNDLTLLGVRHDSLQGDKQIINILKQAGANIHEIENGYYIKQSSLIGCNIDLKDCPDLGPILNVMAMYAQGKTTIYNAQRLRYKESDRIAAMEEELKKCHVDILTSEGEIVINGNSHYECESILNGHKDHRIVMSLSVAATLFKQAIIIEEAQAINKSYPAFFEDLMKIGVKVEVFDD